MKHFYYCADYIYRPATECKALPCHADHNEKNCGGANRLICVYVRVLVNQVARLSGCRDGTHNVMLENPRITVAVNQHFFAAYSYCLIFFKIIKSIYVRRVPYYALPTIKSHNLLPIGSVGVERLGWELSGPSALAGRSGLRCSPCTASTSRASRLGAGPSPCRSGRRTCTAS